MKYDLHIHSALSPCADRDMTPANIAGMAKLAGAELIAVADHNSALNLPAVQAACDAYGLGLLPAIEANTAEEVHLLCYLPTVEAALELGEIFYAHLPAYGYDPAIWGEQWVMDTDDNILRRVDKLLTGALTLDIGQVKALCEGLGALRCPPMWTRTAIRCSVFSACGPRTWALKCWNWPGPTPTLPWPPPGGCRRGCLSSPPPTPTLW